MDQNVVDAQIRWPDVPAAFGWLSLDPRGQWRLHAGGSSGDGGRGDPIANQQIVGFINRNYSHDDQGRWFFQNGPQRVYVRLDAAALILHYSTHSGEFVAHTGERAGHADSWILDDLGRLFVQTQLGPGMVIDRDLAVVLDAMSLAQATPDGLAGHGADRLLDTLAQLEPGAQIMVEHPCSIGPAALKAMGGDDVASAMAFVPSPKEAAT